MKKAKVLFICSGNSARSQMGEALLRKIGGEYFEAYSAGLEPKGINPLTLKVMKEIGMDISNQRSKKIDEYLGKVHFGYVITTCAEAEEQCPIFPGVTKRYYWPLEDPASFSGTEEEKLTAFRKVRDQIRKKVQDFIEEHR
ncbi:arsenate reductase ArsC [bacterium]|nr:arsenate reductase ArsC [bacterium]